MNFIILFIVLNLINVVLQTIKALATVKSGKLVASLANALAFGFYTIVVVYMVADFSLLAKVLIVGGCNFVGVFVVKLIEERISKDNLYMIRLSLKQFKDSEYVITELLDTLQLSYTVINTIGDYLIIDVFAYNKQDMNNVKTVLNMYDGKAFISRNTINL